MFEEFREEREKLERSVLALRMERQSCLVRCSQSLRPPGLQSESASVQVDLSVSDSSLPRSLVVVKKENAVKRQVEESEDTEILPAVCTSLIRTVHAGHAAPVIQASTPPYRPHRSVTSKAQAESAIVLKDMERIPATRDKETMTHVTRLKSVGVQVTTRDFSVLSHVPEDAPRARKNKEPKLTVADFVYPVRKGPAIEYQPGPISSLVHPAYSSSVLQTYAEIYKDLSRASKAVLSG